MIDSRVDDAIKQHAQKMDWLLMEAGVGVGKVGVLLPKEMPAGITAQDTASIGQTEDTSPTIQQILPLLEVESNSAQTEAAILPSEVEAEVILKEATTLVKESEVAAGTAVGTEETIVETATAVPLVQEVESIKDLTEEVLGTAVATETMVAEVKEIVTDLKEAEGIPASIVQETVAETTDVAVQETEATDVVKEDKDVVAPLETTISAIAQENKLDTVVCNAVQEPEATVVGLSQEMVVQESESAATSVDSVETGATKAFEEVATDAAKVAEEIVHNVAQATESLTNIVKEVEVIATDVAMVADTVATITKEIEAVVVKEVEAVESDVVKDANEVMVETESQTSEVEMVMTELVKKSESIAIEVVKEVEPAVTEITTMEAEAIPTEFAVETEATASEEPKKPHTTAIEFTSEDQTLATEIVKDPLSTEIPVREAEVTPAEVLKGCRGPNNQGG
ncbi:Zonadhesin [Larimichthys crocea]|uniref:Uncharacterized protein n=1 Tax=Larimichthys crocea TaxID=215358 RepID=A0ACD3RAL1_LARCR|nr:Zonadhesin [Larimichthys crocea]